MTTIQGYDVEGVAIISMDGEERMENVRWDVTPTFTPF